ncbi:MAG: hypothetical protein UT63_C0016G0004 [Candidatus Gottesmanbacteria bacterium GW2011_GWC2_39_8]|uniref:DUF5673 domain-containing protein n=1 Tax=Candidatus Gottesmanbacteria bacterium GW2011_GWC2_39_8 TaxID=1618450 RepID=A0A0G0SFH7_9BACT|nr:MAG: hypothetical protein UT63_C0016G0004 [Candidatus Gottesmanbacteria bacterium GW2011_GWC2_39_8]
MPVSIPKTNQEKNLNKILVEWESPSRPFKKRNKEYFQTIAAIVFLMAVILIFAREWLLFGAVLAIVFVAYGLASVPPDLVKHKITQLGVTTSENLFEWHTLGAYWFEEKWGQKAVVIHTRMQFPPQIRLMLGSENEDKLKKIIGKYLPFVDKPPKSWGDRISEWLGKKIQLEENLEPKI